MSQMGAGVYCNLRQVEAPLPGTFRRHLLQGWASDTRQGAFALCCSDGVWEVLSNEEVFPLQNVTHSEHEDRAKDGLVLLRRSKHWDFIKGTVPEQHERAKDADK
eukprot:5069652-Amphidinium_carterae.3